MTASPPAPWPGPAERGGREALLHTLTRRRGLPVVALRVDRRLVALNGWRLRTPGFRRAVPAAGIHAVAYHAELRPTAREVLAHLLDRHARLVPRSLVLAGQSVEAAQAQAGQDTRSALTGAIAAAARHLGMPVEVTGCGIRVDAVRGAQRIRPGDRIVAVDGAATMTVEELLTSLRSRDTVRLSVQTGLPGADASTVEDLVRGPDGRWGLRVSTDRPRISTPLDVDFDLPDDLVGASLGLGCALAVVDAFTEGSLSRAGHVAATGAVTHDGRVRSVSGLELKARSVGSHPGIRTFLVPPVAAQALAAARRLAGTATVIPVADLEEAAAALVGLQREGHDEERGTSDVAGR